MDNFEEKMSITVAAQLRSKFWDTIYARVTFLSEK